MWLQINVYQLLIMQNCHMTKRGAYVPSVGTMAISQDERESVLGPSNKVFAFQLTVAGVLMEAGHHVRVLVEEAVEPEEDTAITLHRVMVVALAVDHRHILKVAILTTVQVF